MPLDVRWAMSNRPRTGRSGQWMGEPMEGAAKSEAPVDGISYGFHGFNEISWDLSGF